MRPDPSTNYPGRTHRFFTGTPVFRFGHGLSYTTFESSLAWANNRATADVQVPAFSISTEAAIDGAFTSVAACVTNTGKMVGDEVILLMIKPPTSAVELGAPRQQLAAFTRISLRPGEAKTATLAITNRHVTSVLSEGARKILQASTARWHASINTQESDDLKFTINFV